MSRKSEKLISHFGVALACNLKTNHALKIPRKRDNFGGLFYNILYNTVTTVRQSMRERKRGNTSSQIASIIELST